MRDAVERSVPRVEAVMRILEHDLDLLTLRRLVEVARRDAADRLALKDDVARVGVDQAADEARERALSGAALAHQTEAAAGRDTKRHVVDRLRGLERFVERGEFEQRGGCRPPRSHPGRPHRATAAPASAYSVSNFLSGRPQPSAACRGAAALRTARRCARFRPPYLAPSPRCGRTSGRPGRDRA